MKKLFFGIWNLWFKFPEKLRFLLVGGFNTVVSYLMFIGFVALLGAERYQQSLVLAWILSSVISFSTQKMFVFCTSGNWFSEYCKCCLTWMLGYFINAIMLEFSVKIVSLNIFVGQALAIILTTVCTYILFKYFAFKGEHV